MATTSTSTAEGEARYLSTLEVAQVLGLTSARVRQLALAGRLREVLRVGGRRIFCWSDVESFRRARQERGARPVEG